ncbi:hypothetical protein [Promicromonospora sukumoe]|uniref:hypothetical protein n=1 Tax=Promicromonospora sukumoe TaxID=88382 RepID=UPI00039E1DB3|nr:hypothetical protein [Promicromonospora sukumoe]
MDTQSETTRHADRFVPRDGFAARPQASQHVSLEAFRADQDALVDGEVADPFER